MTAMLMVLLLCVTTSVGSAVDAGTDYRTPSTHYGLILDAGSSGTKLKIFKWNRPCGSRGRVEIEMIYNNKFKVSISDYIYKLNDINEYLQMIIKHAKIVVPSSEHSKSSLFFMATAGLRIYPAPAAAKLMSVIYNILTNRALCPFPVHADGVRILSGEEEGVYAWVAANYLRNFFWSDKPPSQAVGVLEMGGGSTQIAFIPDGPIYANMFPVWLGGQKYNIYAHSYLFYGQNYMLNRINNYLITKARPQVVIASVENPCMLKGDNKSVVDSAGNSVLVIGSGHPDKCLQIINIFLESADEDFCHPKPCAIGRTYQPSVGGIIFYAISAFLHATQHLGALDSLNRLNARVMKEKATEHCQKSLQTVVADGLPAEYGSEYCAMGLYIPSLLVDAYGFPENTTSVYATRSIGGVAIDWTMGAMLIEIEDRETSSCDTSGSGRTSSFRYSYAICSIAIYLVAYCRYILGVVS
ncbi:hypothetical protein CHS0354_015529 [Potamilus streckersoni]|uniref:Apyrase n=1 Tax=Potamilus streckersoni TaxID=2493646 RepID=A0AAE0W8R1_9BIVA|nr:hypothetical protein CHS0354_015529 [Potamilus streckersoni]